MLRLCSAVTFVLALCITVVAEDTRGKVKSVDADKGILVITVDDKDKSFTVPKEAKIYTTAKGKKGKAGPEILVDGGLAGVRVDSTVTVTTETKEVGEKKEKQEVVVAVKVDPMKKKKKGMN
jgi:hypothetical protein